MSNLFLCLLPQSFETCICMRSVAGQKVLKQGLKGEQGSIEGVTYYNYNIIVIKCLLYII